jgi:hypothetical protein
LLCQNAWQHWQFYDMLHTIFNNILKPRRRLNLCFYIWNWHFITVWKITSIKKTTVQISGETLIHMTLVGFLIAKLFRIKFLPSYNNDKQISCFINKYKRTSCHNRVFLEQNEIKNQQTVSKPKSRLQSISL